MSQFKFSTDLFLEKIELNKFQSFLSEEGYKKYIAQNTKTYGFIDFINIEIQTNAQSQKLISLSQFRAIDSNNNYLSAYPTKIIPYANNQWYWLKVKHIYSPLENGTVSIDSNGNLSSSTIDFTKLLRGQPNFPSRIKFPNSSLNTDEYDVIEVVSSTLSILQGNFQAETDIKVAIVGTFTPGKTVPELDKFPFQYDSVEFEWVQESSLNIAPNKNSVEYWLLRAKSNGTDVFVQNKQSEYFTIHGENFHIPTTNIVGIDFIRHNPINTTCESNQVAVSWGIRSSAWTIGQYNKIFLQGCEGGLIKSISQLSTGELVGYRIYTPNGKFCTVISCVKNGSVIELTVDTLDYNSFSIDGGETFLTQEIIIAPANDFVEITFLEDTKNVSNETQTFTFPCNYGQGICQVLLTKWPKTYYRVIYRFVSFAENSKSPTIATPYRFIEDDAVGYLNEFSFNTDGSLKEVLQRTPFESDVIKGYIVLTGFPHSYYQIKQSVLKNNLGVEYIAYKSTQQIYKLFPSVNKTHQVIFGPNALGSVNQELYLVLTTEQAQEGSYFILELHSNVLAGNHLVHIVTGFVDILTPGTILKTLDARDFGEALNTDGDGVSIECIFDGADWHLSQRYVNRPQGEIVVFDGTAEQFNDCFDGSGLGKGKGWKGYAICNGANGTPNLVDRFIFGTADVLGLRATGGSAATTLTIDNIPKHHHDYIIQFTKVGINSTGAGEEALYMPINIQNDPNAPDVYRGTTTDVGGGTTTTAPTSLMPPYTCLAYVKRIY